MYDNVWSHSLSSKPNLKTSCTQQLATLPYTKYLFSKHEFRTHLNLNRQNWNLAPVEKKISNLCVCVCLCVCPLSCQGIAAYSQPPLQHSYQASHQPQSHLSMISLWAMRQENASQEASCKHTVPESITSPFPSHYSRFALSLSLSASFPALSRLACTI